MKDGCNERNEPRRIIGLFARVERDSRVCHSCHVLSVLLESCFYFGARRLSGLCALDSIRLGRIISIDVVTRRGKREKKKKKRKNWRESRETSILFLQYRISIRWIDIIYRLISSLFLFPIIGSVRKIYRRNILYNSISNI